MWNSHAIMHRSRGGLALMTLTIAGTLLLGQAYGASSIRNAPLKDRTPAIEAHADAERTVSASSETPSRPQVAPAAKLSHRCDPPRPDPFLSCYWETRARDGR